MEDKEKNKKNNIKNKVQNKTKKTNKKVVQEEEKVEETQNKKKKRAFTLIELLAVIIILGILMIVAIPSVTSYINDSRKSAYVDTAKEIVSGTRNIVNEGSLGMYDTDTTYYIESGYIKTENASKSPYGEFVNAYVIVTYNGKGYTYYWTSVDDSRQGVRNIVKSDLLTEDDIESDIDPNDITPTVGIGNRSKIVIIRKDGTKVIGTQESSVGENGGERSGSGSSGNNSSGAFCIRATTLHTSLCSEGGYGCEYTNNYSANEEILFGNQNVTNGTLRSGDAFDCDVNNDGTYDATTERFYYMTTDEEGNAVLVYYSNVSGGISNNTAVFAYDSSGENWHGPRTAYQQLPSTTQWSNPKIVAPGTRAIGNEYGQPYLIDPTNNNQHTKSTDSFPYTGKAARFLTIPEVNEACHMSMTDLDYGSLKNCDYLMENFFFYDGSSETKGYWLETPESSNDSYAYILDDGMTVDTEWVVADENIGVRPAITVAKPDIDY